MKITKITIENYRSIKKLDLVPNKGLNVFIGENSVGKTNIFNAINWLLGSSWPSFNYTEGSDHWKGSTDNKIRITTSYDDGTCLDLDESKDKYQFSITKSGGQYSPSNNETRAEYASAYLDIKREIQDYLPSNKWSLLGRVLQQMNSAFLKETMVVDGLTRKKKDVLKDRLEGIRDEILFSVGRTAPDRKDGYVDKFLSILRTESARQLNKNPDEFSIDLSMYDPWNFYRTLQLLVKEVEMDMQFQASTLGMGVQASITIAVLKAYASLHLPNKTPIFLDEPELFLHPQAQRNFYNMLREMTEDEVNPLTGEVINEGLQIFYTTHSPNFLRTDHFDEIHLVRKDKDEGTYCKTAIVKDFVIDLNARTGISSDEESVLLHFKNAYENTGDSQRANEAFFAKKIILVEGQSEILALPYFFDLVGFDHIREGISIVRCGNKDEIDRFFRLYNEFGIPCYIIFDGDKQHEGTKDESRTMDKNKVILGLFASPADWSDGIVHDRYFGFEKEFESHLGFTTTKKGIQLFIEIKENITKKEQVPIWVNDLVTRVSDLSTPLPSILKDGTSNATPDDEITLEDIPF